MLRIAAVLAALVAVPTGASAAVLWQVGLSCLAVSVVSFTLMALAFSAGPVSRAYLRAKRGFDAVFAALFGFAAVKILTARLT